MAFYGQLRFIRIQNDVTIVTYCIDLESISQINLIIIKMESKFVSVFGKIFLSAN